MWSIFRETFLGKESGGEEYTRDVPATRGKSALIFRAGVIVLQQSMIYLNFEELNSMRLVCPRMRYEIHQWSIVIGECPSVNVSSLLSLHVHTTHPHMIRIHLTPSLLCMFLSALLDAEGGAAQPHGLRPLHSRDAQQHDCPAAHDALLA